MVSKSVIYEPGNAESARSQHEYQHKVIPAVGLDPAIGLSSNASATEGSQLSKLLDDAQSDILAGRRPMPGRHRLTGVAADSLCS